MYKNLIGTVRIPTTVFYFLYFTAFNASIQGALNEAVEIFESGL